jgi:hypothetical protein
MSISALSAIPAGNSAPYVAQTGNAGLIQAASSLAAEASAVATLGSSSGVPLTYSASGLLDSFVQAGAAPAPLVPTGSNVQAQNAFDQGIVGSLPVSQSASGAYSAPGSVISDNSANWALALKSSPSLSYQVAADSFSQSVVGTLLATA